MTMGASIEARMPFMDRKLAAFIAACPDTYRISRGQQKWILREALKPLLPAMMTRPKASACRWLPVRSMWFRTTLKTIPL